MQTWWWDVVARMQSRWSKTLREPNLICLHVFDTQTSWIDLISKYWPIFLSRVCLKAKISKCQTILYILGSTCIAHVKNCLSQLILSSLDVTWSSLLSVQYCNIDCQCRLFYSNNMIVILEHVAVGTVNEQIVLQLMLEA